MRGRPNQTGDQPLIGLTFDDGPLFDFADFVHPQFGPQRGFLGMLRDFRDEAGASQPELHATSFVIASAEARAAMERAEDCGYRTSTVAHGRMVGAGGRNRAALDRKPQRDHVHHAAEATAISRPERDNFSFVDNYIDADREIRRATDFIRARGVASCRHFAFPFGHTNAYLVDDYLPTRRFEHGMEAAFGVDGRAIESSDSIWNIPRLVCGYHWRSPQELEALLRG